ncbi:MAG: formimidoylglutamate deiminase [Alphaproteobacteria bacterium]|nr:formimidoylglutamate deiminase [Alphaproteobacteria bacterium]
MISGSYYADGVLSSAVALEIGRDGRIAAIGADASASDAVIVPGVPNLHSHAFQRAMAGLAEGAGGDFWQWRETMYRFLAVLSPDDVRAIAAQLYVECLLHGYTAVAEFHYLHNAPDGRPYDDPSEMANAIVAAAEDAGIGLLMLPVLYRRSGFGGTQAGDAQRRFVLSRDAYARLVEDLAARVAVGVAPHSLRAVTPEELAWAVDLAGTRPIHIHIAEQTGEVDACLAWSGARPVQWLLDHAPVDHRWCLVHATHIEGAEIHGIAHSGAVAGLCQTTEANLGDGVFPLVEYLAAGGRFGIGSDSHVSTSPVEELRWLDYIRRLETRTRRSLGAGLLDRATEGGARAFGFTPYGGIGGRADLVVLDPEHPALVGRSGRSVLDGWLFSGNTNPVRDVMVGGAWVVRDGVHVRGELIAAEFRAAMRRIAARL